MLTKRLLLVLGAAIFTASPIVLQAQDTTRSASATNPGSTKLISGIVTNEKGIPLEDVTVQIKGSRTSTKTGSNGAYSINAPQNAVLVFSMVGMNKQEISSVGKTSVGVQLQPAANTNLDDIIVVGYGTQKTRNVTGSMATIDLKKIEDMPVASVPEALRGQVPGLSVSGGGTRPGTMATVSIRQPISGWGKDGSSSLPLIIIDDIIQLDPSTGLPSMDQFNLLDMSEIESITVLRDAAAAIYGSRASQGAIVIKTKRGKNGPPKISYSGKFEQNDAISHVKTMDAYQYGVFANRFGRAAGWAPNTLFDDNELQQMKSINYDWRQEAWKKAYNGQHSLNVSGGTDRATYFAGVSYYTQGANLGEQDYKKWTFRTGSEVKVSNNVKLSTTLSANNFNVEKSFTKVSLNDGAYGVQAEQNDYVALAHMPKYIPWMYNVNGVNQYVSVPLSPKAGAVSPGNNISSWNYFGLLNNGSNTNNSTFAYNANFSLQYDVPFVQGLSFKGTYAIGSSTDNTEQVALPLDLATAQNVGVAGSHLYSATTTWKVATAKQGSRVSYIDNIGKTQQWDFLGNYDRSFGLHNISAMVGMEKGQQDFQSKTVLYDNPLAGGYNGSSSSAGTLNTSNSIVTRSQGGNLSYLGRFSYNYNSKYLFQFVFRSDASTKFAPENYWGFFPSVSAGWVISSEDWFRNAVPWVNNLKIRGSIGKTGNDNVKAWRWLQLYNYAADKGMQFGSAGGNLGPALTPDVTPNRNVKWDHSIKHNLGIDFSVLNNRLSASIDGYYDKTSDILTALVNQTGVPISAGGAAAEQNYSSLNTWGGEFSVNWKDRIGEVTYGIGMNYGWSNNKVTKYFPVAFNYPSQITKQEGYSTITPGWGYLVWRGTSTGDGMLRTDADIDKYWQYLTDQATKVGGAPAYFTNTDKASMKKGMLAYQDLGGFTNASTRTIGGPDGRIDGDGQDLAKLVNRNITQTVNTNINVAWRNLTMQAQIVTSWGGLNQIDYVKQGTSSTNMFWAHESFMTDMYDPTDNPNGKYPNLFYGNNGATSDFWKISSFRCFVRSLSVGYNVPKEWAKAAHLESARLYIAGSNLWDFYNPYPDKYRNMYDAPTSAYPTLRTWALGVNVGF